MADEWARAHRAQLEAERVAAKTTADLNEARVQKRKEFAETDQGHCSAEIAEAERLMRLPTFETLKATGAVLGDPTKGPAS